MRISHTITLTAGTPIQVVKYFTTDLSHPYYVDRLFIEMLITGTGNGYVCWAPVGGAAPSAKGANQGGLLAQLAAADANDPGGQYDDNMSPKDGGGIDLREIWVDGDDNDPMLLSVNVRV